jgi:hypothetical protein
MAISRHRSGPVFKAGTITPRDIISRLPEHLIDWLHQDLDRTSCTGLRRRHDPLVEFEDIVTQQLFPQDDARVFVQQLRCHSHVTAIAARTIAPSVGFGPETLFVCGLLHDVGVASAIRHADAIGHILDAGALELVWATLQRSAAQHAIWLATRWRLPSLIRYAIRDQVTYATLTTPSLVASAIVIAESLATFLGYGFGSEHQAVPPLRGLDHALAHLRIHRHHLAEMAQRIATCIDCSPTMPQWSQVTNVRAAQPR